MWIFYVIPIFMINVYRKDNKEIKTLLDEEIIKLGKKFDELNLTEHSYSDYNCTELKQEGPFNCDEINYFPYEGRFYTNISIFTDKMKRLSELYKKLSDQSEKFIKNISDMFTTWRDLNNKSINLNWTVKGTNCNIVSFQMQFLRDTGFLNYILSSAEDNSKYEEVLGRILEKFSLYVDNMKIWETIRAKDLIYDIYIYDQPPKENELLLDLMIKRRAVEDLNEVLSIIESFPISTRFALLNKKKDSIKNDIKNVVKALVGQTKLLYECQNDYKIDLKNNNEVISDVLDRFRKDIGNDTDRLNISLESKSPMASTFCNYSSYDPTYNVFIYMGIFTLFIVCIYIIVNVCTKIIRKVRKVNAEESVQMEEQVN